MRFCQAFEDNNRCRWWKITGLLQRWLFRFFSWYKISTLANNICYRVWFIAQLWVNFNEKILEITMLRANEPKKQLKNCRYTSKFGILTSVFWIFPQIWGQFIYYIECKWLYLNITSVDIDFIKKSVYIHLIDVINLPVGETVSVGVVI